MSESLPGNRVVVTNRRFSERVRSVTRNPVFYLCLVVIVYAAFLLPTLERQGITWDEQNDIFIARSYVSQSSGWFIGSDVDPSQTRLPMFTVALVYALLNTDDLLTARLVSVLMGALTLIAVYVYCRRDYNHKTGLLACAILATSPFFLSFARIAFTESDIFVACVIAWLLVCVSILQEKKGCIGWAAVTALVLGLAMSAKFTAIFIFPAIVVFTLAFLRQDPYRERLSKRDIFVGAALLVTASAFVLGGWAVAHLIEYMKNAGWFAICHYLLVLFWWLLILVWVVRHRDRIVQPSMLAVFVIALSLLTFLVVPPVHITNRHIVASLARRFYSEMAWDPGFMSEAAALHLASVTFKSGPVIGLGLLVGCVATLFQWKRRREVRFPLLVVLFYFLGLVLLPLAQTFYMIPLLPILAVFGSDQLLRLLARGSVSAAVIGILAAGLLIVDLFLCYPDYNLNGYQWLGARYLVGRSTIGYRSVVQTTSDGVQQVAQWLNENVRPGESVVAYVNPWIIVRETCPDPPFTITKGEWESLRTRPDFVILHINYEIRQRWVDSTAASGESVFWQPYDAAWLDAHYRKVFSVKRAFGIEMASVWKRNDRAKD
jgi:MFS family permease